MSRRKKMPCPTCKQDLWLPPHRGKNGKDCPHCGQGLSKTIARRVQARLAKERTKGKQ